MQTIACRCTPDVVRTVVAPNMIGAYALGNVENGEFVVKYVGRSDSSLQQRLLAHNYLYCFEYFIFQYAPTPKEAFELESRWWHDCRTNHIPLKNKIHPDSPAGLGLSCPYCSFSHHLFQLLHHRISISEPQIA